MNMASRRTYRNLKKNDNQNYTVLKLNDVLCPICRSILIEPVTLPCNHGFCLSCFKGTVENANLVCPLCRIRIGSWLRKAKKESALVNVLLWEAINHNYGHHVKNKLEGIEENLEEESRVIVSLPGEIRKEYEIQKQKDDEELRKIRESENKASQELIKKLKEEDDYQKAVMDEKLRLDEEIAKRIAAELSNSGPSTSKVKTSITSLNHSSKYVGPMDKFLKKDNETVTSQSIRDNKQIKKFAEKEYTCRVLYLDRGDNMRDIPEAFSPIIKKKIQQIQKNIENEQLNDSFEAFEADMRYFKPIETYPTKCNGILPIKLPLRKPLQMKTVKIISPIGIKSLNISFSAFARVAVSVPPINNTEIKKRKHSTDNSKLPNTNLITISNTSPILTVSKKRCILKNTSRFPKKRNSINCAKLTSESPPFFGFDNKIGKVCDKKQNEVEKGVNRICIKNAFFGFDNSNKSVEKVCGTAKTVTKQNELEKVSNDVKCINNAENSVKKNGSFWMEDDTYKQRLIQEQADLEFAKKLQAEFDKYAHYTRSTRKVGRGNIRRQTTLDEILTGPYRVK